MKFIETFLNPVYNRWDVIFSSLDPYQLGNFVLFDFNKCKKYDIVFLGFLDLRNNENEINIEYLNIDYIRIELYQLYWRKTDFNFFDLGDLIPGNNLSESLFSLEYIVRELNIIGVKTIVLGGNNLINYNFYTIFSLKKYVHFSQISPKIPLGNFQNSFNDNNLLTSIITNPLSKMMHYTLLGFQTYLNPALYQEILKKMNFDSISLGRLKQSIHLIEPYIRTSDWVNIDLNSCWNVDFSKTKYISGINGNQMSRLLRLIGSSEYLKLIHFSNLKNSNDKTSLQLLAQFLWHLLDGNDLTRSIEENKNQKIKYSVIMENGEIIFHQEKISKRWWMECCFDDLKKTCYTIPCHENDYLDAMKGEIPERYLMILKKNI